MASMRSCRNLLRLQDLAKLVDTLRSSFLATNSAFSILSFNIRFTNLLDMTGISQGHFAAVKTLETAH
jgi:hypothetical protein